MCKFVTKRTIEIYTKYVAVIVPGKYLANWLILHIYGHDTGAYYLTGIRFAG